MKSPQILRGSFSAVWTATIARLGSFFSIFHGLQDVHTFAPLRFRNFSKNRQTFCRNEKMKFIFIACFRLLFAFFRRNLDEFWPEFHRNVQKMTNCLEILRKSDRKIWKMSKFRKFRNCDNFHFFISFFH